MNPEQAAPNQSAVRGAAPKQLGDVVERVSDAVFALGRDWRFTYVNREAGRFLARNPEELIGKNIWTEFPEAVEQPFKPAFEKALAEQTFVRIEAFYEPQQRWFEKRIFPSPDGISVFFHDITEQKLLEESARQSRQLLECQNRILELIAQDTPMNIVLSEVIRVIEEQSPGMLGSVLLLDPDGVTLYHTTAPSLPESYTRAINGQPIGPCAGSWGTAAFRGEPVIVEDIATDPLWEGYRDVALSHGLRACWSRPIFDNEHRVLGTFALYYDQPSRPTEFQLKQIEMATQTAAIAIMKHRKTEALLSSEERLRLAVAAGAIGIWEWDVVTGRVICNDRLKEIYGLSKEEADVTFTKLAAAVHPDDLELVDAALRQSLAQEPESDMEYRVIWPDGSIHWVASRGSSVRDCEGVPLRMFGVARDITHRKQAEQEISRRDVLLRNAESIAHFGTYEWLPGEDSVKRSEQLCKIFGVTCQEFEPTSEGYLSRVHPDDRENSRQMIEHAVRSRTPFKFEERIILPDGTIRHILSEGNWVDDDGNRAAKLIGICKDITSLRNEERANADLENQLQQIQKLDSIGRFAGGMAHDFNNLLGAILGFSELAAERVPKDDAARMPIEQIRSAAQKAIALTSQLLAFSRRQAVHPVDLDLNSVIDDLSGILKPSVGTEISLNVTKAEDLGTIRADATQIEQVLMNLVLNARDSMATQGEIVIETRNVTLDADYVRAQAAVPEGRYVMLTVADTGAGMEEATKSHIFEPFFTTKPPGKGTGLGLSVVHGIAKRFGAHIEVQSYPGRGTAFKIFFPRVDAVSEVESKQIPQSPTKEPQTILLLINEFAFRHFMATLLEQEGYRVLQAANASQALAIGTCCQKIDLLLSAVVMPDKTGPEIVAEIREWRPEVKALYMSGYPTRILVRNGLVDPHDFLLQKPFTRQELLGCVQVALEQPTRWIGEVA